MNDLDRAARRRVLRAARETPLSSTQLYVTQLSSMLGSLVPHIGLPATAEIVDAAMVMIWEEHAAMQQGVSAGGGPHVLAPRFEHVFGDRILAFNVCRILLFTCSGLVPLYPTLEAARRLGVEILETIRDLS